MLLERRSRTPERTLKKIKGAKNQISNKEYTEIYKYCKLWKKKKYQQMVIEFL